MKRGETGAVNSAKHSEVLVHRRTGKQVSKSRHINARSAAHRSKHQTSAVDLLQGSCLDRLCIRARKSPMTDINVRLHAWSTRFHLGLVLSQITCLTAGSHEPRASQRVTTWEDHSPHARNVQHTDSEDRVMPLASFQKEAKGVASPVPPPEGEASKAARQTLHSRNGSSPRAKQDMLHGRRMKAGERQNPLKCAAKMSQLEI